MAAHILLVEDETIMLDLMTHFLERAGYKVSPATTAAEALSLFEKRPPDLVLLDLVLPDEDGLVIIRKLRAMSEIPIIVLSGRAENAQRTAALELGANDFINKGVDTQELLIRIKNILTGTAASDPNDANTVRFAGWSLDMKARELLDPDGTPVHITASEFLLLSALAKRPGHLVNRQTLIDAVSGIDDGPAARNLDTYINRLRKKIESNPKKPEIIITMKGLGYRLMRD